MITFRGLAIEWAPPWLRRPVGARVLYTLGVQFDALVELTTLSLLARYPVVSPPDALAALGRDRAIVRGFAETDASYAARLNTWRLDRRAKGSPLAKLRQLSGYMLGAKAYVVSNSGSWWSVGHAAGDWDYDGQLDVTWRYWVVIQSPWQDDGRWGDDGQWGDGGQWASTISEDQIKSLILIIKGWEAAHAECHGLIFVWDDGFDPPLSWGNFRPPQGDWGAAGKPDGAGNYVLARDGNAAITGRL